jgi:hypothetical protein
MCARARASHMCSWGSSFSSSFFCSCCRRPRSCKAARTAEAATYVSGEPVNRGQKRRDTAPVLGQNIR